MIWAIMMRKVTVKFWRIMLLLLFGVFLLNWVWQDGKENSKPRPLFLPFRVSCCYAVDSNPEKIPTIDICFGFDFLKFYWSFYDFFHLLAFGNCTIKLCTCKQKRPMIYLVTFKKSSPKSMFHINIVHFNSYCFFTLSNCLLSHVLPFRSMACVNRRICGIC